MVCVYSQRQNVVVNRNPFRLFESNDYNFHLPLCWTDKKKFCSITFERPRGSYCIYYTRVTRSNTIESSNCKSRAHQIYLTRDEYYVRRRVHVVRTGIDVKEKRMIALCKLVLVFNYTKTNFFQR